MPAVKPEAGICWTCCECEDHPSFDQFEMSVHLRDEHGIDTKTERALKCGVLFLDGAGWYSNTYEWTFREGTIAEMKFQQTITGHSKRG